MSKNRILAKVRTNDDYSAIADYLKSIGFHHTVHPPRGKGHPFIRIKLPHGPEVEMNIACTPRGGGHKAGAISAVKGFLAKHGY